jgi:hypothetical protein
MRLRLVDATPPTSDGFDIPDRDLRRLPTRPGVSQERLSLCIPAALAAAVGDAARKESLREDVWIGLVVESERTLRLLAPGDDEAESLRAHLDEVAARPLPPVPGAPARASGFAAALRDLRRQEDTEVTRLAPAGQTNVMVSVSVPAHAVIAWRRGAIEARQTLGEWASGHLRALPPGRVLWEAGAVEAGETLAEWVLAQEARRRSTR